MSGRASPANVLKPAASPGPPLLFPASAAACRKHFRQTHFLSTSGLGSQARLRKTATLTASDLPVSRSTVLACNGHRDDDDDYDDDAQGGPGLSARSIFFPTTALRLGSLG